MDVDFETFVAGNIIVLARFAGVLTGDRQFAHDVLAEALIRAGLKWNRVRSADDPIRYTRAIITRVYLDIVRTEARRRAILETNVHRVVSSARSGSDLAEVEDRDQVKRLLASLNPTQRCAVVLRFYLDLTTDDVAKTMNCPPATARSHLRKGLAALRANTLEESL